ncbi:GNAT family N-acetyltransferase [Paenibacillus alvei]|uniref:GNAT family N-acetyltransferase n=1 Tax=Paenibacillus TaxID=44249 RepID=UPI0022825479|nr:GNAT family N-acetyltransferase [Paenibacillus alvei]
MITLKNIDQDNWEESINLRPSEEQSKFIASNLYSIAEVQFLPGFVAQAIYEDEQMIGFTMYGLDADDGNYWIYRFMIDEKHQSRGYGKQALQLLMDELRSKEDRTEVVFISYNPENERAKRLYASVGFVEQGLADWGEMMAKYQFEPSA